MDGLGIRDYEIEETEYDDDAGDELFDVSSEADDLFDADMFGDADDAEARRRRRSRRSRRYSARIARARAQRAAAARRAARARQAHLRRRRSAAAAARRARAEAEKAQAENKVTQDVAAAEFAGQSRRMGRAETSIVAGKVTDQIGRTLASTSPALASNPIVAPALGAASLIPLLISAFERKQPWRNPAVVGSALIAGIAAAGQLADRSQTEIVAVRLDPMRSEIDQGDTTIIAAELVDNRGNLVQGTISWQSSNDAVAKVDNIGAVEANAAGNIGDVRITATAPKGDGTTVSRTCIVKVK